MSNHASVIITWATLGDNYDGPKSKDLEPLQYQAKYKEAILNVCKAMTRSYLGAISWGCGCQLQSQSESGVFACENVAVISVNGFSLEDFMDEVKEHAPFLLEKHQQLQIMYKTEDMDGYKSSREGSFV